QLRHGQQRAGRRLPADPALLRQREMSGAAAIDRAPGPAVAAVFEIYPPRLREALLALRGLILAVASEAGVEVVETLKWGQPSYLPARPRVGTTVRIDALKGSADGYAMYVHCQTTLMDS